MEKRDDEKTQPPFPKHAGCLADRHPALASVRDGKKERKAVAVDRSGGYTTAIYVQYDGVWYLHAFTNVMSAEVDPWPTTANDEQMVCWRKLYVVNPVKVFAYPWENYKDVANEYVRCRRHEKPVKHKADFPCPECVAIKTAEM